MKNYRSIITGLIAIFILSTTTITFAEKKKKAPPTPTPRAANGSLFTDDARNLELVNDPKPHRIGDIVFIDVVESSAASVSSSGKHARESGSLGGALLAAAPIPGPIVGGAAGVAGALGSRKYEGKGSTERKSELRARIAARVVEVLPNGDMRIEAEKHLKINRETEKLKMAGVIRSRDITTDNAVPSTSVADLRVELNGKGIASSDNAPGWLVRILEKVSPF